MRLRDSAIGMRLRQAILLVEREVHWRTGHPKLGDPKKVDDAYVTTHYPMGSASWATPVRASTLVNEGWTYAEELDTAKHVRHRLLNEDGSLVLVQRPKLAVDSQTTQ
jgi:hypothetical protein